MNAPPVARATFQYAAEAIGSPSIGNIMTLIGICLGSRSTASPKSSNRRLPVMVAPRGWSLALSWQTVSDDVDINQESETSGVFLK